MAHVHVHTNKKHQYCLYIHAHTQQGCTTLWEEGCTETTPDGDICLKLTPPSCHFLLCIHQCYSPLLSVQANKSPCSNLPLSVRGVDYRGRLVYWGTLPHNIYSLHWGQRSIICITVHVLIMQLIKLLAFMGEYISSIGFLLNKMTLWFRSMG